MVFYGYHGDLAEEKTLGQRFVIDLALTLDIADAARTDDLETTVDYIAVYALCRKITEDEKVKLLETLAGRIIDAILKDFPLVSRVEITVKKPSVSIRGAVDYVAIETSKERENSLPRTG
jgi:dihydroneopterin aldolase